MKLMDLQNLVSVLAGRYDEDTEVEFTVMGDDQKLELAHVNHFREITTTVHPRNVSGDSQVDTIFVVFSQ